MTASSLAFGVAAVIFLLVALGVATDYANLLAFGFFALALGHLLP